jgi:hypothetical protein
LRLLTSPARSYNDPDYPTLLLELAFEWLLMSQDISGEIWLFANLFVRLQMIVP